MQGRCLQSTDRRAEPFRFGRGVGFCRRGVSGVDAVCVTAGNRRNADGGQICSQSEIAERLAESVRSRQGVAERLPDRRVVTGLLQRRCRQAVQAVQSVQAVQVVRAARIGKDSPGTAFAACGGSTARPSDLLPCRSDTNIREDSVSTRKGFSKLIRKLHIIRIQECPQQNNNRESASLRSRTGFRILTC